MPLLPKRRDRTADCASHRCGGTRRDRLPTKQVLATKLVIASTGAMLIVGHEAPCRISALACRTESRNHTGKAEDSRQVSGTSDASKTQSMLIRTYPPVEQTAIMYVSYPYLLSIAGL